MRGEPGSLVGLRAQRAEHRGDRHGVDDRGRTIMDAAQNPVLTAAGLVKRFGATRAVDGLDLSVAPGEVHGFLGPNGAGKSTTIRMLLGLIRPSAGMVRVFGLDPWTHPVTTHRDVAYVPGDISLWPNLSGGEAVDILTGLRGGADDRLLASLIDELDFDPRKKARAYSKGNRQKVALIAAFARPARLYILDEPTSGLDPVMDAVFRRHVERVRDDGASVLLSSHILSEVEQLCDRVTIIRSGSVVETGTLASLRHLSRTHFRVGGLVDPTAMSTVESVHDVRQDGAFLEFDVDAVGMTGVLAFLATARVTSLEVTPISLETLFLRHYGVDNGAGVGR
jgi:ABC-2 type transport system ATP-binding protein